MTEQPPSSSGPPDDSPRPKRRSLLERAASTFPMPGQAPAAPVPADDAPPEARRSLLERAASTYQFKVAKGTDAAADGPVPPSQRTPEPEPRMASDPLFGRSAGRPVMPDPVPAPAVMPEIPDWLRAAPPVPATIPAPAPQSVRAAGIEGIPAAQVFRGHFHPIDRLHLREQCLIEPDGPVTALLEEFRIIKRQLLLTAAESRAGRAAPNGERILVASAHSGEGKTFCAVNLALSIAAEKDNEVLLVDADFAKPSVLSTLGLPGGPGLLDVLADPRKAIEDCILGTDIPGLFVLPAGNTTGSDTEYLASSRTAQVVARLTAQAPNRIVIFDSPPVLAASPATELALHVGQTVVVVRADVTGDAALRDTIGLLSGCPDIKLLLNCTRFSPTGRRFGTYYGYRE